MSQIHLHLDSFNAGELSPLVSSRFNVEKVASGCRLLRNFIIHPHGPAFRRPGMEHMGASATNASASNLRSFQFSNSTVFILELAATGLRVWKNGALVSLLVPVVLPYAAAELPEVQMTQVNDVVYLTHPNHEQRRLVRHADNDWRISTVPWRWPALGDENPGSQALPDYYEELSSYNLAPYLQRGPTSFTGLTTASRVSFIGTPPAGPKRVIIERLYSAVGSPSPPFGWLVVFDQTWTGSLPSPHPVTPLTVAPAGTATNSYRIRYQGEGWTGGEIRIEDVSGVQLASLSVATPTPAHPGTTTVTAGNWKYVVNVTSVGTSPYRATSLVLQTRPATGGSWTDAATVSLVAPITTEVSGWNAQDTEMRWLANGFTDAKANTSDPEPSPMVGTAKLYRNAVSTPYQTSISVSNAAVGSGRTLTANRPLFKAGHAGAFWQLTHRRENAYVEIVSTSAAVAATAVLSIPTNPLANATVTIGTRVYKFVATPAAVDDVDIGVSATVSAANLAAAINAGAGSGTAYHGSTPAHADVTALASGTNVTVTARKPGTGAHAVAVTMTVVGGSWDGVFLHGGVGENTTVSATQTAGLRINGKWDVTTYGSWASTLYLERLTASGTWEYVRSWRANKDRNVSVQGETDGDETLRLRVLAGTASETSTEAAPRFILEAADARTDGLVKITAVGPLNGDGLAVTATCEVLTAVLDTTATYVWTEGAWSDARGFPRAVALHQGRLWFGGTKMDPMGVWGSVTADIENFRRTSLDDGGLFFTPSAGELNMIQSMQSQGDDLVLFTMGDEWTIRGENGAPITPLARTFLRQSSYGSAAVPALLAGEVVVFVQRGGRKVRRIGARSDNTPWATADMTVLAEHIAQRGIVQMAYGSNPNAILWAVTADGKLLGMTLEVEQNVFGWHVHETDGLIESVAVVYGADADEVWLAVKRGSARSIERLDPLVFSRRFDEFQSMIYSDAAKVVTLEPASATVPGLAHLNGKSVAILADGIEQPAQVVSGGSITLDAPASVVVVGLPYESILQPSRREVQTQKGTSQGNLWRVARMGVYLHDSRGGRVAESPTSRFEALPYPGADLYSGDLETPVESTARTGVQAVVKTSSPLPFNIGAIVLKLDLYGD
jgi:hypothetical protein